MRQLIKKFIKKIIGVQDIADRSDLIITKINQLDEQIKNLQSNLQMLYYDTNLIGNAIADAKGFNMLKIIINRLHVPAKYEYIFFELKDDDVCIDGGANIGLFTDAVIHNKGICYTFEPNPVLYKLLQQKYLENKNIFLYPNAISNKNETIQFMLPDNIYRDYLTNSVGGTTSVIENIHPNTGGYHDFCIVNAIDLQEFIVHTILKKHEQIYLLKLDIEGAEFGVLESLINEKTYEKIKYIVCETHERAFKDGIQKIEKIKTLITENNIANIFLDWQ